MLGSLPWSNTYLNYVCQSGNLIGMDIIGGIVLMDPETDLPYSAPHASESESDACGAGILGMVVLIDPDTGEPYRLGA